MESAPHKSARTIGIWAGVSAVVTLLVIGLVVLAGLAAYAAHKNHQRELQEARIEAEDRFIHPDFAGLETKYLAALNTEVDASLVGYKPFLASKPATEQLLGQIESYPATTISEQMVKVTLRQPKGDFEACVYMAYAPEYRGIAHDDIKKCTASEISYTKSLLKF